MKRIILCALTAIFALSASSADITSLSSPNKQVSAKVTQLSGNTYLDVYNAEGKKLSHIQLGISAKSESYTKLTVDSIGEIEPLHEEYDMLHGKHSHVTNDANTIYLRFLNSKSQPLGLDVRVYNNGVTFRYTLADNGTERTFVSEATSYTIPSTAKRWIMRFNTSYEGDMPLQSKGGETGTWCYPMLFHLFDTFMLITEANAGRQYCNTHVNNTADANIYRLEYPFADEGYGIGDSQPTWKGAWTSPWRVLIIGKLADIAESTLVEDVAEPCTMTNTSWIKPGSASWVYWAYNHGTRDYQICCQYVDLAVEMGWPYVLFDWEWENMGNGGNIQDACNYAKSKGVKPMVWYHSNREPMVNKEKRVAEFKWLKSIGVVGVKIDFFESDKQHTVNYFLDILDDAREAKILINFHGATIPRGWTRTYPHLMSTEGVFGAEQYNNGGHMTTEGARINCTFPFTRNVVGPMDYTPVAFTDSQHPHTTTYAHELALSVVFESALQHWADRPEGFYALPAEPKQFMKEVPTSWDETKLIDGYPGEHVIMARRKGDVWYVGGLQGENVPKTFELALDFLAPDTDYLLTLNADGSSMSLFQSSIHKVHKGDVLNIPCLARGGFAISIKPETLFDQTALNTLQTECEKTIKTASSHKPTSLGYYDANEIAALQQALDESRASTASTIDNYIALKTATTRFSEMGYVTGGPLKNAELTQNVTYKYLLESRMFSRADSPNNRFGKPANWTVENYDVTPVEASGRKQGIDTYPGYNCITLGVWHDAEGATGNLKLCKLYRTINLPAGRYFFGASYESNYYNDNEYIFAAPSAPTSAVCVKNAIACAPVSDFGTSETLGGITFTLDSDQQIDLGWCADLAGKYEQEFRIREVVLLRYLDEAEQWIESEAIRPEVDTDLYISASAFAEATGASKAYGKNSASVLACPTGTTLTIGQVDLTDVTSITVHSNTEGTIKTTATYELLLDNAETAWANVPAVKSKGADVQKTTNANLPTQSGVHTLKLRTKGMAVNIWGITLHRGNATAITTPLAPVAPERFYTIAGQPATGSHSPQIVVCRNGKFVK